MYLIGELSLWTLLWMCTEVDLGMFSMIGRTGAPQKGQKMSWFKFRIFLFIILWIFDVVWVS